MSRLMSITRKPAPVWSAVPSGALSGELCRSLGALFWRGGAFLRGCSVGAPAGADV